MTTYRLGVDIGGTFTDIILLRDDGTVFSKKILSTPDDYSRAIEEGVASLLEETGVSVKDIAEFGHGTTVATNTIIERRGVRVGLITTKGFRDVLELGRFRSPRLYDHDFRKPEPLVERRLRFEVSERVDGKGDVVVPLDMKELDGLADRLIEEGVEAVAVCFLNAYVNPRHEAMAQRHLQERLGDVSVSVSTQLLPQIQEYERTSTTVVNAYIRPVVERYVRSLKQRLQKLGLAAPPMIMQSSGGVLPADMAGANPVYIIESGPAAGVVGAQRLGRRLGLDDIMVLDMGGTTAKASLIQDGDFVIMPEAEVGAGENAGHRLIQGGGYSVQVPTIDIAEVGAGGGSIAAVDAAGGARVGPRSAGAVPGPVCYDQGGDQPTVTDADLVLGYLNPKALVGGDLALNIEKAKAAVAGLGERMGLGETETAYGIHQIVNANMMRALSAVSSERGRDPAQFTLIAMGGNGGGHAGGLAETLGIRRILVPPVAGLFSALGLLFADLEHQMIGAFYRSVDADSVDDFNALVSRLAADAEDLLQTEGFREPHQRQVEVFAEMKYTGQTWTLSVPCSKVPADADEFAAMAKRFSELHLQNYGYNSDAELTQFVSLKVIGRGIPDTPRLPDRVARGREREADRGERQAYFGPEAGWLQTPVMPRSALGAEPQKGPLIVEEYDTTTIVRPGWQASLDQWNNIVIERM